MEKPMDAEAYMELVNSYLLFSYLLRHAYLGLSDCSGVLDDSAWQRGASLFTDAAPGKEAQQCQDWAKYASTMMDSSLSNYAAYILDIHPNPVRRLWRY